MVQWTSPRSCCLGHATDRWDRDLAKRAQAHPDSETDALLELPLKPTFLNQGILEVSLTKPLFFELQRQFPKPKTPKTLQPNHKLRNPKPNSPKPQEIPPRQLPTAFVGTVLKG